MPTDLITRLKNTLNKRWIALLIFLFLTFNLVLFVSVNLVPILYQESEVTYFKFFWSLDLDAQHPFGLHSGFNQYDLRKIFLSVNHLDAGFRTRQFSYFIDMFFFKIWQFLEINSFANCTGILFHLINVILLGRLIFYLTLNVPTAIVASLLLLNAGNALSTLLFPFIIPKILVMTLFLLIWLLVIKHEKTAKMNSSGYQRAILATTLLCFFTDEIAFFILPILLIFLAIRNTPGILLNSRAINFLISLLVLFTTILLVILALFQRYNGYIPQGYICEHLHQLIIFLKQTNYLRDITESFSKYFLRRNLGYWDWTLWGKLSVLSSMVLFYIILKTKQPRNTLIVIIGISVILFLKALMLPHTYGIHPYIMPAHATFPSLLFFSHYYSYPETVFLALILGLLLDQAIKQRKGFFFIALILVSIVNISNVIHFQEGIRPSLEFQKNYLLPPTISSRILSVRNYINRLKNQGAIYLSFPSGSRNIFHRRLSERWGIRGLDLQADQAQLDPDFFHYASVLPVMYVRSLEKGICIMSLENVKHPYAFQNLDELSQSQFFLDVPNLKLIDLSVLKEQRHADRFVPHDFQNQAWTMELSIKENDQIILFIKGPASLELKVNEQKIETRQIYGQSYQLFEFSYRLPDALPHSLHLKIVPILPEYPIKVIGPFLLVFPKIKT